MSKVQEYEIRAYFGDFYDEFEAMADDLMDKVSWEYIENWMYAKEREEIHSAGDYEDKHFLMMYLAMFEEPEKEVERLESLL